jgi:hypothetical protein
MNLADSITVEQLREILDYDQETGLFKWKRTRRQIKAGAVAGTDPSAGYVYIFVLGKRYAAHRLAWFYVTGEWPAGQIDHRNLVTSDNAFANLRDVSGVVNKQNMRDAQSNSKTGVLGVSPRGSRFIAVIQVARKQKYLGLFETQELASQAYQAAKRQFHVGASL